MPHAKIDLTLSAQLSGALQSAFGPDVSLDPRWIARPADEKFGDYQFNGAMPLSKRLGQPPRQIAAAIAQRLQVAELFDAPEIAGPGFINFRLKPGAVAARLSATPAAGAEDRLGIPKVAAPQTVVLDMASPNLAKEMHVGHLRSTVIGDSVARMLEFEGHHVQRINHVGDWGTQFGMLLAHLRHARPEVLDHPDQLKLGDLEAFYVEAKRHFDSDPAFANEARRTVVALQSGDPGTLVIWRAFCAESLRHCHDILARLGITGLEDRGESSYNDQLASVLDELTEKGLVVPSAGALCIFVEGFKTREGTPLPLMLRKSDGGYGYATTDLAALRHRIRTLRAQHIVYVVGASQKQHFEMLFAVARRAGWTSGDSGFEVQGSAQEVVLEHLAFGNMLGPDGRPFKTREGGTVKLKDLLAEAVDGARAVLQEGSGFRSAAGGSADSDGGVQGSGEEDSATPRRQFTPEQVEQIARAVGIGAVKYFDLAHALASDYRFDWDTMLALDGNTAPYMLYAYARIRSIGRKAGIDFADLPSHAPIVLEHESELKLAKMLLKFSEVIEQAARELRPNLLTDYLYELSKRFSLFYDRRHGVRVIDAEPPALRLSRLRLCDLTARTLKLGLSLLGIATVEQM
jgi:arginyl-tRNA synthetase